MRERSLCFLKGGLALQTVNNDDTPATAVAKAVEATWCLAHRLLCPLGKQSCKARSRGCVHACSPAGLDQLSVELAAHSQISCGCFLPKYGENRLFMEELWVLKHCCANSNSSEVWRLILVSSKEYGLWK